LDKKLNILVICNKSPWPAREGGPIAMNNIIEGLIDAGHEVKVLALNTNKYHVEVDDIPSAYRDKTKIELAYIDLSIKMLPAFLNLFSTKSYHVERFKSKAFEKKLIKILQATAYDIVQIELLYMSPYLETIRKYSNAKVVLRAHNIEHLIWERLTETEKNPIKKRYLKHLSKTLKLYEHEVLDKYDGIVPITMKDAGFFKEACNTPVCPVSFGINLKNLSGKDLQKPENALFHIGAMNWLPNEEGIRWLIEKVWPLIHQALPDLKLYLAGREMPTWLNELQVDNIEVIGEVPDAAEFILSKSISVAPLLSGSGIRIKIIESMALGKAVIATSIGAEGIHYTNGENIMIADTPEEFLAAVKCLYQNPDESTKMGANAKALIEKEHNTNKIIEGLVAFYWEIL
jgi:glycosyltransferase involved in cell wall biosynthesis